MATGKTKAADARTDPYRAYNFKLEILGVPQGHFTSCTGLGVHVEAIRYREAGQGQVVRRLPGQVEYDDLTLRFGLTDSLELFEWLQSAVKGSVERKDVSVVMLAPNGHDEAMRWNLFSAWPSSWSGASLDASSQEVALEQVTLVYESLEIG
jgi:phage tail-like protein